jgi:hypothetical protein
MSWLYSRALVEEFSAGNCLDGEPLQQLSVMPTQHKFWRNDKTIEASQHSRFGLTSAVLTGDHGTALLTSYLAAFPARTSALPEKVQESTANGLECGATWLGSLGRYDPASRSWKTAQRSFLGDLEESLETWPRSGMTADGECWELPMLAFNTKETGSGLLPTVTKEIFAHWASAKYKVLGQDFRKSGARIGSVFWWVMTEMHLRLGGMEDRTLNPDPSCGESVMGWPIGFTELKPLETGKFQEWQQQHGECLEGQ